MGSERAHKEMRIDTRRISISGDTVEINVKANLQDDSGNDLYTGFIEVLVIAEVDRP